MITEALAQRDLSAVGRWLRRATGFTAGVATLLVAVSLVPSDEVYYEAERLLSHAGSLGRASQHIRSAPATLGSIILESFQGHSLEVEGVSIDLDRAVNPTDHVKKGSFPSKSLGDEKSYWVYLPPGYEESSQSYPTVYLLHGMSQGHRWWTEVGRADRIATAMIASGKVRPFIMVMPNGNRIEGDVHTTGLYDDGCATGLDLMARLLKAVGDRFAALKLYQVSCEGNFEEYIAREVTGEIDSRYRTNGERYVGGFSIGGRGALQLALRSPDVFDGAFGLSGNYDFVRDEIGHGRLIPEARTRLFLASGKGDHRSVYGRLNTFLFHKELASRDIDHRYCTFDGAHNDRVWISALPHALAYVLGTDTELEGDGQDDGRCRGG